MGLRLVESIVRVNDRRQVQLLHLANAVLDLDRLQDAVIQLGRCVLGKLHNRLL